MSIPTTELDQFMPTYQFHEFHQVRVTGALATAYGAIRKVTAGEIRLFRALTWMRCFGRELPESVLNAPKDRPVLEVALRGGFWLLAEKAENDIVVRTVVLQPKDWTVEERAGVGVHNWRGLARKGFAVAAMNFRVVRAGDGYCMARRKPGSTQPTLALRGSLHATGG